MCLRIEGHANTATRLPRGYRVALYLGLQDLARAQPAFLTQNLHQPFGLISPSTSVQAFGSGREKTNALYEARRCLSSAIAPSATTATACVRIMQ